MTTNTWWKISAAWAIKRHDCTPHGIAKVCGGMCCRNTNYWPPSSGKDGCPMLGDHGCTLGIEDRPLTCLMYPLRLNKNGTMVLHYRTTQPTSVCKTNHGQGPPLIQAIGDNLAAIFGIDQYRKAVAMIQKGKSPVLTVPDKIMDDYYREREWERNNEPPQPRSTAKPVPAPRKGVRTFFDHVVK